ncbi:hypothetical protein [Pseudomonas sp. PLMAX]|uniref:hypothetical protein n=1 Tax=Pseudomonas sp. PLMAX TaxID=2201998 RepID=UPI0038BE1387
MKDSKTKCQGDVEGKMAEHPCCVPWLDGRPLINAIGTNETECHANLSLLDLSDDELLRVVFLQATVNFQEPKS